MLQERWREAAVPIAVFVLGLGTIAGAWFSQLVMGFQPCHLCLQQRIPYYVGLPIVAVAIVAAFAGAPSRWVRLIMAVSGVVWAIGVYLAVNHAGIEWGLWPGPTDCVPTASGVQTIDDLRRQVDVIRIVPCDRAVWRFLGLSFAGWNAVMSVILTAGAAWAAAGGLSNQQITIVRKTPKVAS